MAASLPIAISFSKGDRLLGARNGTVAALVRAHRLRAVPWRGRTRILVADLQRVAAEGLGPDLRRPRPPRRKAPRATTVAAAIMAIDVKQLGDTSPEEEAHAPPPR